MPSTSPDKEKKRKNNQRSELETLIENGFILENGNLASEVKLGHIKPMGNNVKIGILYTKDPRKQHKGSRITSTQNIGSREDLYIYAEKYYTKKYGFPLKSIRNDLMNSQGYKEISCERALQIFYQLGLTPEDNKLFKYALLLDALPMPPEIEREVIDGSCTYHFNGNKITDILAPGFIYIKKNLEVLKRDFSVINSEKTAVKLYDSIGRSKEIELAEVYSYWLENPSSRKFIEYSSKAGGFDLFKLNQYKLFRRECNSRMKEIMDKNYNISSKEDLTASISVS